MTRDVAPLASHTDTVCATCVSSGDERVAGACVPVGEDAPFFSIVMPCYGVEAYIGQALECILKQTERSWELIVVDDATPDASASIAERAAAGDARIRVVHHERNLGLSGARNTGISQARGEYVWICDTGKKYHASPNCSKMNYPYQVTIAEATRLGYGRCKKCYR